MERFLRNQNIERYRKLLLGPLDEPRREQISKLLAEEEARACRRPKIRAANTKRRRDPWARLRTRI
jgi:hypothetical protein